MRHIIADPPYRAIDSETKAPQENSKKRIVFHAITATPPCDDLGVHFLRIQTDSIVIGGIVYGEVLKRD